MHQLVEYDAACFYDATIGWDFLRKIGMQLNFEDNTTTAFG